MYRRLCLLPVLLLCLCIHAQDVAQLEAQADQWAEKSYMQNKALSAYLQCFREAKDNQDRTRLLDKVGTLISARNSLMARDAIIIDSLIEEARPKLGKDLKHYLPLVERRIIMSMNSSGKYQREFVLLDEALALRKEAKMLSGTDYEKLLRKHISMLLYKKDLSRQEKLAYYKELWRVYRENSPGIDSLDIKLLDQYASQASLASAYQEQVELYELKKEYILQKYGKQSEEYMKVIQALQLAYYNLNEALHPNEQDVLTPEKDKDLTYRLELIQLKKENGIEQERLNISVVVSQLLSIRKDTVAAQQIATDFMAQMEQLHGKESKPYCDAFDIYVNTYESKDKRLIPILEELLAIKEKAVGKEDNSYQYTQSCLTSLYSEHHQQQAAIDIITQTAKDDDIYSLMSLSIEQSQYGQFRESIDTYGRMMEFCAKHPNQRGSFLLTSALGAINCFAKLKDVPGMLAFGKKWQDDSRFAYDEQKFIFLNVVSTATLPGNSNETLFNYIDDFMVTHAAALASPKERAEILEQKATVLFGMQQVDQAYAIFGQNVTALEQSKSDVRLILKYRIMQEICLMAQDWIDEALALNLSIQQQMVQVPAYQSLAEYRSLCCREVFYRDRRNETDDVLRLCQIIGPMSSTQLGSLDPTASFKVSSLSILANGLQTSSIEKQRYRAYYKKGLKGEAEKFIHEYANDKMRLIRFTLNQLGSGNQQNNTLWTREANDIIANNLMLAGSDSLAWQAYDYTLLYKQAFLAAESMMREQILGSDNAGVREKFEELQNLRTTILQHENAGLPTKELQERLLTLETQLISDSKMFGDFTRSLNLTWRDIQQRLKPSDVAIEFISYTSFEDDEEHVAALLLRADSKAPQFIHLFARKQIPENVYSTSSAQLFWGPLLPSLSGIKNIFFAPAGCLYNIGIESMAMPDDKGFIFDRYHLYRISSTRELAGLSDQTAGKKQAVVYGGIDYETSTEELQNDARRYQASASATQSEESTLRSLRGAMSALNYLPHTKTEAENISGIIGRAKQDYQVRLLTGSAGTETSFKALSGQQASIIHISTHGFYEEQEPEKTTFFLLNNNTEDRTLTRSGLLFAGADNAMQGEEMPEHVDDGILTAQEISTLDLRGLQLAVLSACQTAQGDVTGDGVFGLQRGFKKAGAKSILMSLWKVDDEATSLLMTTFYEQWMQGKSKCEALEQAKRAIRTHEGWEDPKYWAAFILLDSIED